MVLETNMSSKVESRYIYSKDYYGDYRIQSVIFDSPIKLSDAISEIRADENITDTLSYYRYYNDKTLSQIQKDLSLNDKLNKLKVKGMLGYGQTAYVFETEQGDILKITNRDHFLGRKHEKFDCPIKSFGKMSPKSFCYYYFVEKTNEILSAKEINICINKIKELGYKIVDHRLEQFGKSNNGDIFLIDPECARKNNLFGLIKYKFMKIKSLIKMMK